MALTLLRAWPEAARRETGGRMLALHFAAQGNYEESVVIALLGAHPAAATCRDEENLLPLDHAVSYGMSSAAALAALVAADMPIDPSGAPVPHHQASWTKAVTMPRMAVRVELPQPQPQPQRQH